MENTPSPSTVVSSNDKEPHTLDLNKADGKEYDRFINSIRDEFKIPKIEKLGETIGKHKERESVTLKKINHQLELCFKGLVEVTYNISDEIPEEDSPAQTPLEGKITSKKPFFQVTLSYQQRYLYILIQRSNLYLVGYKFAGSWIILSGGCCEEVVEFVKTELRPDGATQVQLGASYFQLFSAFDPDYEEKKKQTLATDLCERLTGRLRKLINREEQTDYVVQILQEIKKRIIENVPEEIPDEMPEEGADQNSEESSEEVDVHHHEWRRVIHLLNWLKQNYYISEASEPADADTYEPFYDSDRDVAAKKFKEFWEERFQNLENKSDRDAMKKLIQILEAKHKVFLSQGQQQSDFCQWVTDWKEDIRKAVKIVRSLGYGKEEPGATLKRKEEHRKKLKVEEKTEEVPTEDLSRRIELITLLEKEIPLEDDSDREMKKKHAEELIQECDQLKRKGNIPGLINKTIEIDKCILNLYSKVIVAKDLYGFYEKLNKIATTLDKLMRYFRTGADYSVQNTETTKLEVNRQALILAFEYLTRNPFVDGQGDFAKHITHLVVMICEATRIKPIAQHIKDNYTVSSDSHLSADDVSLINMWSDLSSIMVRGWSYRGERDSEMVAAVKWIAVSRARKWTNSLEDK